MAETLRNTYESSIPLTQNVSFDLVRANVARFKDDSDMILRRLRDGIPKSKITRISMSKPVPYSMVSNMFHPNLKLDDPDSGLIYDVLKSDGKIIAELPGNLGMGNRTLVNRQQLESTRPISDQLGRLLKAFRTELNSFPKSWQRSIDYGARKFSRKVLLGVIDIAAVAGTIMKLMNWDPWS